MSAILDEGIDYGGNNNQDKPSSSQPNTTPRVFSDTKSFQKDFPRSSSEFNTIVESSPAAKKKMEEVKQMMNTFKEKVSNYPKYMSYDGSMVLCVLLSMNKVAAVNMRSIPIIDQTLIKTLLPEDVNVTGFDVKFDDNKDFILIFNPQDNKDIVLTLFNTVAHPRPEDLTPNNEIEVEADGEKIEVGGKIKMNKRTIQKLFGHEQTAEKEELSFQRKQGNLVNKTGYEIRADVLQMAIDWAMKTHNPKSGESRKDDDIIYLAKKFYSFVENKR